VIEAMGRPLGDRRRVGVEAADLDSSMLQEEIACPCDIT
jgi:hypothetical protein